MLAGKDAAPVRFCDKGDPLLSFVEVIVGLEFSAS
jgi:hypothetical protein